MNAPRDSVEEDISISMFTERTMSACEYEHPSCVEKAMKHLDEYIPIPPVVVSRGKSMVDTYDLLSTTLRLAPTPTGQIYVSACILSCQRADDFFEFAKSLFWELFVPFKSCGGRTPAPSRVASTDSIPFVPQSPEREAVRLKSLKRCDYQCPITKKVDTLCPDDSRAENFTLEGVHILPFSLNKFDETDQKLMERRRRAWSALQHFSGEMTLQDEFSGNKINSLRNIIAFEHNVHKLFGEFRLWLRPSDGSDRYTLVGIGRNNERVHGRQLFGFPHEAKTDDIIPLINLDSTIYESVDSRLLNIHASLAEILHLTGAGAAIEQILRDLEEVKCLAVDGSSTEMLDFAMHRMIAAF